MAIDDLKTGTIEGGEVRDTGNVLNNIFSKGKETKEVDNEEEEDDDITSKVIKNKESEEIEEEVKSISFQPFINTLLEEGILDELPEDLDDNIDGFKQAINHNIEKAIEQRWEAELEGLSEDAIKLIEIAKNGGDIKSIIETIDETNYLELDYEDDETAEEVAIRYYSLKGYEDEDIVEKIEKLKETGKLGTEAEKFGKKLQEYNQEVYEEKIKEQEALIAAQEEEEEIRLQEELKEVKTILSEMDEIDGIKITKEKREQLIDYIYKPIWKDEHGNLYSQWQVETMDKEQKLKDAFRRMEGQNIIKAAENKGKTNISKEIFKELGRVQTKSTSISRDKDFDKSKTFIPKVSRKYFGEE